MKLSDELCESEFAKLPLELKQWIIATTMELNSSQAKHPDFPSDKMEAAAIVTEEAVELARKAFKYRFEKGRYYDMHRKATQTAAMCFRFLLNAPEK